MQLINAIQNKILPPKMAKYVRLTVNMLSLGNINSTRVAKNGFFGLDYT